MGPYLYVKAFHILAVISWMAGLLYIVRLFIYHVESAARPEPERSAFHGQFAIMERRLWLGITWPAMVAAAGLGTWLMILGRTWTSPWFHLKLALLALLLAYHLVCGKIRKDLLAERCRLTSLQLRIWNEVSTLLMFAIVLAAVTKNLSATGKAMLGVGAAALAALSILTLVRRRKRGG